MKREFAFDEALRMLEVTWSSLPKSHRQNELGNKNKEFNIFILFCYVIQQLL